MTSDGPRQGDEIEILDEIIDFLIDPTRSSRLEQGGTTAASDLRTSAAFERRPAESGPQSDGHQLQPIFVLSCNRAGSTLLRFILDTHEDIYCPPELFLGQAAHTLAIFLCGLEGKDSYYEAGGKIYVADAVAETLRTFITDRLTSHAARRGKRFWCEKTAQNLCHLQLLDLLFPQAKYLCLHRHCLDVVASAMQMAGRITAIQRSIFRSSGHILTGTIRWWCEMTRSSLQCEREHPERCFRLRYEDLVADPQSVLGPLFSFLGVAWDERILEDVFSAQHDRGFEDPNIRFTRRIHSGNVGNGSGLSLDEVPDEVVSEMNQLLSELGYPEAFSRTTSPARRTQEISMPWLFETFLPEQLAARPDLAASINRSLCFAIDGPDEGSWVIDLRPNGSRVLRREEDTPCTIMISAADLAGISRGDLNARKAFMERRMRLAGSIDLATLERIAELFRQPSAQDK